MTAVLGVMRFLAGVTVSLIFAVLAILSIPFDRGTGRLFHKVGRAWAIVTLFVTGVRVRVAGLDRLRRDRAYIYVSNHASLFDIPVVFAGIPDDIRVVYKKELERIPVFGWGLKMGAYISIERGHGPRAARSLEEAVRKMRQGASLLLYAEGTRTMDGRLQQFKRGAFNLALRAGVPVVPLTINGTFSILRKHSILIRPGTAHLILGDPIEPNGTTGRGAELELMDTVHREIVKTYIDQT
jgi:1-acyl-sn-glycerol-3-phosphate acyltransferase